MSYSLPILGYSYSGLEPVFTAEMLELHYTKHHAGYINKLNDLLQKLGYSAPENINDFIVGMKYSSIPEQYRPAVRFHAGGHANHAFFWNALKPGDRNGQDRLPPQEMEEAINAEFKTLRAFKEEFTAAAMGHLGSGWAWLCVSEKNPKKLFITTTLNHDNPQMLEFIGSRQFGFPILTLDLWEHAYYLKYKNNKLEYFNAFWKIIDWDAVYENYKKIHTNL